MDHFPPIEFSSEKPNQTNADLIKVKTLSTTSSQLDIESLKTETPLPEPPVRTLQGFKVRTPFRTFLTLMQSGFLSSLQSIRVFFSSP